MESVHRMLNLSQTSILRGAEIILKTYGKSASFLPSYTDEKLTRALSDLLKDHNSPLSAVRTNPILHEMGYLEKLERRTSGGKIKDFWSITKLGLKFGKNETAKENPNQTHPRWYVESFPQLLAEINAYLAQENLEDEF